MQNNLTQPHTKKPMVSTCPTGAAAVRLAGTLQGDRR